MSCSGLRTLNSSVVTMAREVYVAPVNALAKMFLLSANDTSARAPAILMLSPAASDPPVGSLFVGDDGAVVAVVIGLVG